MTSPEHHGLSNQWPLNTLRQRQNGRHFPDTIFQTPFSSEFSWMKMYKFGLRFHWNLFLGFELTIFHHYLTQWWLVYWRIYASLCLNELIGLFNRLFLLSIKKAWKLSITGPLWGESTSDSPVDSPHKGQVKKMSPCHDILMITVKSLI